MSIPCEWCKSTSETIDSLEYQVEQLESQLKALEGDYQHLKDTGRVKLPPQVKGEE